jgi:hypothetical protein
LDPVDPDPDSDPDPEHWFKILNPSYYVRVIIQGKDADFKKIWFFSPISFYFEK